MEADGSIDFDKADAAWTRNSEPMAPTAHAGKATTDKPPAARHVSVDTDTDQNTFLSARTRRELAAAEREELKLAADKRDVLPRTEVLEVFAALGKMHASARENLPKQLAPKLLGLTQLPEIERILLEELRRIDTGIADELTSRYAEFLGTTGDGDGSRSV